MNKENTQRDLFLFGIEFVIILCIGLPIIMGLINFYYSFQKSIFSSADTLMFIHDRLSGYIIVASPIIILFCLASNIKSNTSIRIMKVKIFLFISIVVFVISLFILVLQFFKCTI